MPAGRCAVVVSAAWLAAATAAAGPRPPSIVQAPPAAGRAAEPIIRQYCITCHDDRLRTGGLSFENADFSRIDRAADTWEKVIRKLRLGVMPPQGARRPDAATYDALVHALETELDK